MAKFFSAKYKISKSNTAENLENISNGQLLIPRWVGVCGVILLLGAVTIFCAAIAISLTEQPNGLFNQTCSSRNCEKALGLKCINKVCQCPENQFYWDSCRNLSSISEHCNHDLNCLQNQYLVCGIGRKCTCDSKKYWNTDLKKCVTRKTFREFCNGDECKSEQKLFCYANLKQCRCIDPQLNYWNDSHCVSRKNYQDFCGTSEECIESQGLICQNSICSCINSEYFSLSDLKCFSKKTEYETCSYDEMCLRPMFCSIRFGCRCPKYYFYEPISSTCTNQYLENSDCASTNQCRTDLGLTCQANKCKCDSSSYTWSSISIKCLLTYTKTACIADSDCNQMENLICNQNENCDCPLQSVNGMCDCKKILGDENYWNGTSCVPAKTHDSSCSANYECKLISESTICINSKCSCSDYSLLYWNGLACLPKKLFGESCSGLNQCLDSQLTTCDGSNCVCSNVQFFDNSLLKCVDKVGEFVSCLSDAACIQPMTCDLSIGCTCDTSKFFENTTSTCQDKFLNGSYCDKDLQCRSDLGLVCANNICICGSSQHQWSGSKCLLTYAQTLCSNDADCNEAQNLVCILGNCTCEKKDGSEFYWNGKMCISANDVGHECQSDIQCKFLTQNSVCLNQTCGCLSPETIYWDGQKCAQKLNYGKTCTNMYLSECLDSELTFCSPSSLKCECPTGQYFNTHDQKCMKQVAEYGQCFPLMSDICISPMTCRQNQICMCDSDEFFENSTSQCIKKFLNGSVCDKDHECYQSKGLTCQNNLCMCNSPTYTWSWTKKECKLTYNSRGCTGDNVCNQDEHLFCRLNENNCFQNISGFFCDCIRKKGNEYYWNGVECVEARSYGGLCNVDCECQTLTQFTICNNSHCQCRNDVEGGFLRNECRKCFTNEIYFDSKCYYVSNTILKLQDAEDYCRKMNNRRLARVSSNNILDYFKLKFTQQGKYWVADSKEAEKLCSLASDNNLYWDPQLGCVSNSINKNIELRFICERDL